MSQAEYLRAWRKRRPWPLPERTVQSFWSKVDCRGPDDCWEWTACRTPRGYGKFLYGRAHRFAWQIANGAQTGLRILHSCDNPPCCNPRHLHPGTDAENVAERDARGRTNKPRGERNTNARLTWGDVCAIRRLATEGATRDQLALRFGVTPSNVSHILAGRTWAQP